MAEPVTPSAAFDNPALQSDVGRAAGSATTLGSTNELTRAIDQRVGRGPADVHQLLRAPFVFTRLGRQLGEYTPSAGPSWNYIYAALNPSEYSFEVGLRESLEKCAGGEVLHSFVAGESRKENLGTYIDEPRITYTLSSGNCLPLYTEERTVQIPLGLDVMFAIQELILEDPRVLNDGRSNDLIVVQSSLSYPLITVEGKVDPTGIRWQESADQPGMVSGMSFTMSVRRSVPRIVSHLDLRAAYERATFGQG